MCDAGGAGKTAAAQFAAAGFALTRVQRQPGFVCRVEGKPAEDPCVNTPPTDAYWGAVVVRREVGQLDVLQPGRRRAQGPRGRVGRPVLERQRHQVGAGGRARRPRGSVALAVTQADAEAHQEALAPAGRRPARLVRRRRPAASGAGPRPAPARPARRRRRATRPPRPRARRPRPRSGTRRGARPRTSPGTRPKTRGRQARPGPRRDRQGRPEATGPGRAGERPLRVAGRQRLPGDHHGRRAHLRAAVRPAVTGCPPGSPRAPSACCSPRRPPRPSYDVVGGPRAREPPDCRATCTPWPGGCGRSGSPPPPPSPRTRCSCCCWWAWRRSW